MRLLTPPLILVLGACATSPAANQGDDKSAKAATQLGQAATAPLSDLNLMRQAIPPILVAAQTKPYAAAPDRSCASLSAEVQALDAALGADLDAPSFAKEDGLAQQGTQALGDAAIGAVRSTAEGVLPFRGWLRKLSGAERRDREQSDAIAAGTIRRAYLKGIGLSMGCAAPAAPMPGASGPPALAMPTGLREQGAR